LKESQKHSTTTTSQIHKNNNQLPKESRNNPASGIHSNQESFPNRPERGSESQNNRNINCNQVANSTKIHRESSKESSKESLKESSKSRKGRGKERER